MAPERPDPWRITPEVREELRRNAARQREELRARKEEWLQPHLERKPVYPETNEEGQFVGLFGYATTIGARIHPYYRTESGIYFYEWENPEQEEKKIIPLDLDRIQREKSAIFYTPQSFLGD
jgi:hypothetical protein